MCFFYALSRDAQSLKNRYQLQFEFEFEMLPDVLDQPVYYASGFNYPKMPVITNQQPNQLQAFQWGLIPGWTKTREEAEGIRQRTLNARSETVFDKPSFRNGIRHRRCLIPADGFYEWREFQGKKYPYFIYRQDRDIFSFAGIWEEWVDRSTGELLKTFSILTTEANSLLEQIHNTKKRMPVILPRNTEKNWLRDGLASEEVMAMAKPLQDGELTAHPISKLITSKSQDPNTPAIQEAYVYPGLSEIVTLLSPQSLI
ncbi:MAG TPA: SOS response-associated peptidase [Bacillota bacterium]|nr:SOS response-associated peptidase [Bacillota bacterium]